MADRKQLDDILNLFNQAYQQKDLEMRKLNAPQAEIDLARQKMRDILNRKKQELIDKHGDDLHKLNEGRGIKMENSTITEGFDQSKLPDVSEQKLLGKQGMFKNLAKQIGKKAAGVIPLAGAGIAALSGDPAMAAEELSEDALGPLAALKPETAGNRGEEKQMLAERKALLNYMNSPAYRDRRGISEEDQEIEELSKPRSNRFSRIRSLFGD